MTSDLARAALSLAFWGEIMPGFRALLYLVFPPALSSALVQEVNCADAGVEPEMLCFAFT